MIALSEFLSGPASCLAGEQLRKRSPIRFLLASPEDPFSAITP